jgi:hypothetical protein
MTCVVCDEDVKRALREGVEPKIAPDSFVPQLRGKHPYFEGVCARCDARGRTRILGILLMRGDPFIRPSSPVLMVSPDEQQQALLRARFTDVTHISLIGHHSDPECMLGVDINDLSRFSRGSFLFVFAICVFDFIETPWIALKELRRVMKRGGTLFIYIQPSRLGDFPDAVKVVHRNGLSGADYAPKGPVTGVPHCHFDRGSFMRFISEAGFWPEIVTIKDHLSDLRFSYFVARAV